MILPGQNDRYVQSSGDSATRCKRSGHVEGYEWVITRFSHLRFHGRYDTIIYGGEEYKCQRVGFDKVSGTFE